MVDYSAVLEELKENLTAATPETQQMHWDNAKRALQAVTDGRTKENQYAKMFLAVGITAVGGTISSYWTLKKQEKLYKKREQAWRQIFDSSMRMMDIMQDFSLSEEEKDKKIREEQDFIGLINDEWGFNAR